LTKCKTINQKVKMKLGSVFVGAVFGEQCYEVSLKLGRSDMDHIIRLKQLYRCWWQNLLIWATKCVSDKFEVSVTDTAILVDFATNISQNNLKLVITCQTEILVHQNWHNIPVISSTLTAIVFLHYRVVTKIALEILGYTMSRVRPWLVSLPL